MAVHTESPTSSPPPTEGKKRKRSSAPAEELEINVDLPEPPSKKALRKSKKGKPTTTSTTPITAPGPETDDLADLLDAADTDEVKPTPPTQSQPAEQRSAHGIWIGNLPWSADKVSLRTFLTEQSDITHAQITRLHMPTPAGSGPEAKGRTLNKPQNKGFAYVDFDSAEALEKALALSEKLVGGRRVLIKDAKSFVGRPEKPKVSSDAVGATNGGATSSAPGDKKASSKRIFVGNLGFDVSQEDLVNHFGQAGEVENVHVATFEDTGKCKGYAWIVFTEIEAAELAVRGFIFKNEADDDEDEEEEEDVVVKDGSGSEAEGESKVTRKKTQKKSKKRKWFINRLYGRELRCEFAEDAQTRYKKRYGKKPTGTVPGAASNGHAFEGGAVAGGDGREQQQKRVRMKGDKDQRQDQRRQKHQDARSIRPGAALANAPRASGAIVEGKGKKTTFD